MFLVVIVSRPGPDASFYFLLRKRFLNFVGGCRAADQATAYLNWVLLRPENSIPDRYTSDERVAPCVGSKPQSVLRFIVFLGFVYFEQVSCPGPLRIWARPLTFSRIRILPDQGLHLGGRFVSVSCRLCWLEEPVLRHACKSTRSLCLLLLCAQKAVPELRGWLARS